MPPWKEHLLNLYRILTSPQRAWTVRRWAAADNTPGVIFCWHRIADDRATPWTVSNNTFLRQIDWLAGRFAVVSLDEFQRRLQSGNQRQPCACITFDDGYAENCRRAIPALLEYCLPFTYFVTVRNVLDGEPFAHDLAWGHRFEPNNLEQLRAMADAGVELGAHAYDHLDLGVTSNPRFLHREITAAKNDLQRVVRHPIRYFAFPFGQPANLSREALSAVRAAGYAGACSAYGGYNFPRKDGFHLQRIVADESLARLKNWATFDPRKLRRKNYFQDFAADSAPPSNDAANYPSPTPPATISFPVPQTSTPSPQPVQ